MRRMKIQFNTKSGFTLAEVLVSAMIFVTLSLIVAATLINCQLLASIAKHKTQAAYAAQQIIETQRQQPLSYFAPYLAVVSPVVTPTNWSVVLDTKGNYAYTTINCGTNTNTLFCGSATLTITPEAYYNNGGVKTQYQATYQPPVGVAYNYYTIAHLAIQISWPEEVLKKKINMNEFYSADIIVNDNMIN